MSMPIFMHTIILMMACEDNVPNWDVSGTSTHHLILSQFKAHTQTEWDNHCQEL